MFPAVPQSSGCVEASGLAVVTRHRLLRGACLGWAGLGSSSPPGNTVGNKEPLFAVAELGWPHAPSPGAGMLPSWAGVSCLGHSVPPCPHPCRAVGGVGCSMSTGLSLALAQLCGGWPDLLAPWVRTAAWCFLCLGGKNSMRLFRCGCCSAAGDWAERGQQCSRGCQLPVAPTGGSWQHLRDLLHV